MDRIKDHHLRRPAGFPTRFNDTREGIIAFIKDTGPEAIPPPARRSREERMGDRLVPVPEPHLKSMPSVLARVRIDSMVSLTELMKQAEHWGRSLLRS